MWGYSFLILFAIMIWQTWKSSAKRGLGVAILLAFLVPTWAVLGYQSSDDGIQILNMDIDMRVAISFVGLFIVMCRPKTVMPLRLHWIDLVVLGFFLLHIISDSYHDGFSIGILLRAFGEWCLPYLVGRTIICNLDDVRGLLTAGVIVATILASLGAIECLTGINLVEVAYGEIPIERFIRGLKRWGFKRAFGPTMNPIYFGVLQLLLLPWTMYAASRAIRSGRGLWRMGTPLMSLAGIVSALSRAPILAIAVLAYVCAMLIVKPRWRIALVTIGVISVAVLVMQRERVMLAIQHLGGELDVSDRPKGRKIVVDEEEVQLTSANYRVYIWDFYGLAAKRAGWLGYGTNRVTGFPVRVPVGPQDLKSLRLMRSIDNVYLLLTLRFGYGAPLLFVTLGLLTAYTFGYLAVTQQQGTVFYAAMAGTTVATMLVLWTVWMPKDFGTCLIMYAGIAAGLGSRLGSVPSAIRSDPNLEVV